YRFDSWTTDNGLPQASVNSVLQTRDGFLWFTTFGGLVRYDGLRVQVFNTGNTKGLRSSRFVRLFEDREGNLWITTEAQGLTRYRDEVFTTYTTQDGLFDNRVLNVSENDAGTVLLQFSERHMQWQNERFMPYTPGPDEWVKARSHRTRTGALWYLEGSILRKREHGRVVAEFETGFE